MNERDAGDYAIGEGHPAPSVASNSSAALVKKSASDLAQGQNFNLPPKLEPFVLLAKNARGASAAGLIGQATGAAGVFVFSELLECNGIKDLMHHEQYANIYQLLELFAYGTWSEYIQRQDEFPELTKAQTMKLKQLSVLSLAMSDRIIPYSLLLQTLDIPSIPALEDLLIESFYSGVLTGRLDQKESRLEVISCLGRDVRPVALAESVVAAIVGGGEVAGESMDLDRQHINNIASTSQSIPSLTNILGAFLSNIAQVLRSLEIHMNSITAKSINDLDRVKFHQNRIEATLLEISKKETSGSSSTQKKQLEGGAELGWGAAGAGLNGMGFGNGKDDGSKGKTTTVPESGNGEEMDMDIPEMRGGKLRKRGRP